jgi:CheY-like chemotaxis protein
LCVQRWKIRHSRGNFLTPFRFRPGKNFSRLEKEKTISLRNPLPNPIAMPAASIPNPAPPAAPRLRTLLIVDDEDGPRQSIRLALKGEYEMLLASDGLSAIELVKANRVDAAVLDIRMIGMSGIELLEKLKLVDPHIEIIMLTAYESIDTVRKALRLGACDYLNKPFDLASLRTAVANAMERRSLSYEVRSNAEKLRELHGELQKQKLQEEMARDRGEIYASIIHDINGPLTIISGSSTSASAKRRASKAKTSNRSRSG